MSAQGFCSYCKSTLSQLALVRALTSFPRTFMLEVLQIAASSNASYPNEIHCLWMQSSGLLRFFSATRFLNPVTFRLHFYLISTAVFCKYLLHFMFLVNFTIAFVLCHLGKCSLGLWYSRGVRRFISLLWLWSRHPKPCKSIAVFSLSSSKELHPSNLIYGFPCSVQVIVYFY